MSTSPGFEVSPCGHMIYLNGSNWPLEFASVDEALRFLYTTKIKRLLVLINGEPSTVWQNIDQRQSKP